MMLYAGPYTELANKFAVRGASVDAYLVAREYQTEQRIKELNLKSWRTRWWKHGPD